MKSGENFTFLKNKYNVKNIEIENIIKYIFIYSFSKQQCILYPFSYKGRISLRYEGRIPVRYEGGYM